MSAVLQSRAMCQSRHLLPGVELFWMSSSFIEAEPGKPIAGGLLKLLTIRLCKEFAWVLQSGFHHIKLPISQFNIGLL